MRKNKIYQGNCIEILRSFPDSFVDAIYLDPPFFTQRKHTQITRDNSKKYEFDDKWDDLDDYLDLIKNCLFECHRILKKSGSIFLHCDKSASHHLRLKLDEIFFLP